MYDKFDVNLLYLIEVLDELSYQFMYKDCVH
jgi:hypothetical protein